MRYSLIELGVNACAICLLALASPALAGVLVPQRDIVNAVQDYVRGTLTGGEDVEITCRWRGDAAVEGIGAVALQVRPSNVKGTSGSVPVELEIRRGARVLRTFVVTADIAYFDTVAVASRALRRGDALAPDAIRFERREVTQLLGRTFSSLKEAEGVQMRGILPVGRIVDRNLTEGRPLVRRGEAVRLVVEVGAVTVSGPGEALSDGAAGDLILVRNSDRQKIQGQVVGAGIVKVTF